ncbi:hypothetical protein PPL_12487 [Heterostelium album PN500]|uniref:Uncharacterized protein n=1 Tax=Heterostelium pallidum (strain ATCC 26659 / Pp 5 / PN500) TaxID=670386 RepID=D3BMR4_HETP5|nr:hypothetical protein PPL_12487 [Heterostelium album PN500]EFA77276.1 hypothetical protein PPL_12487 [Heterostelium album PN500]|eukprot:XP_020429405.1 hypothetical protein PPL_12487 [Heterostelium album PN500]
MIFNLSNIMIQIKSFLLESVSTKVEFWVHIRVLDSNIS